MRLSAVVWAVVGKVETDDTARFHMVIIILGLGEVQGVSETEKERERAVQQRSILVMEQLWQVVENWEGCCCFGFPILAALKDAHTGNS